MFDPWKVLRERQVLEIPGRLRVLLQDIELPDGRHVADYMQLRMPPYVVIVAHDVDGRILCERQYRHGAGHPILTLPAGGIEPGEDPLAAAKRELLEETGYASTDWSPLGTLLLHANAGGAPGHAYLARDCRRIQEPQPLDLEVMQLELLSHDAVLAAAVDGQMPLAVDAMALLRGFSRLGHIANRGALG